MDGKTLTLVAGLVVLAAVVSAGTSALLVTSLSPAAKTTPTQPTAATAGNSTTNGTSPMTPLGPAAENVTAQGWNFVERSNPPAQGRPTGTVVVFLTKTKGDANVSSVNGSIPIELAGVTWDARNLTAPPGSTILDALNAQFGQSPPVALARAALSRNQDGVELTVPAGLNVSTVIVNAPISGQFLLVHWPTGEAYTWNQTAWARVPDLAPSIPARPSA